MHEKLPRYTNNFINDFLFPKKSAIPDINGTRKARKRNTIVVTC